MYLITLEGVAEPTAALREFAALRRGVRIARTHPLTLQVTGDVLYDGLIDALPSLGVKPCRVVISPQGNGRVASR